VLRRLRPWPSVSGIALSLALGAVATPGQAQTVAGDTVEVRSGNHPDFARLVLVYPDRRRWSAIPTDGGYRIDLAQTAGFDVARVFDLIPRDRIGEVTVRPGGSLEIGVVCTCHIDAVELPGRGLVVDIRDGPPPPGNPFELLRSDPVRPATVSSLTAAPAAAVTVTRPRLTFDLPPTSLAETFGPPAVVAAVAYPGADVPTAVPPTALPPPEAIREAVLSDLVPRSRLTTTSGPDAGQRNAPDMLEDALVRPPSTEGDVVLPAGTGPREPTEAVALPPEPPVAATAPALQPAPPRPAAADLTRSPERPAAPTDPALDPDIARPGVASGPGPRPEPAGSRPGRWVAVSTAPESAPAPSLPEDSPIPAGAPSIALPLLPEARTPPEFAALLSLRVAPAQPSASPEDLSAAMAFADVLSRQVGRGIAQGVVDAAVASGPPGGRPAPQGTAAEPARASVETQAQMPPPVAGTSDPLDQIEIATALDIARARERRLDLPAGAQAACRDEALFDAAAWIGDPALPPDFGARRGMVVGEFDRVDPDALEAAVRYHVAFGFGAEARQLLGTFGTPPPLPRDRVEVLAAMSHIVDGETGAATAILANQLACRSRAAIWGALAVPSLPPAADYSATAILNGFEELPNELRRSLGPELANRFLQIGDMETVAALRRSVARIDPPDDPATDLAREPGALLDARVEAAEGRALDAETRLADVARLDGPLAPDAVAELMESQQTRGELPDDALVATAAALATELRGDARGARLRRAEILAHVARDDFDHARAELRRAAAEGQLDTDAVVAVVDAYVTALTARASDRAFLGRLPPDAPELLGLGLSPAPRRAAAERLVALGLPESALPFVDGLVADEGARVIAARAWLRLGEPGTALARVAGLAGDVPARVRAAAYDALGDPGTAARVLDDLGDSDAAIAAAWRAGDLARVASDPDAPRAGIAELARSEDPPVPASLAPLADHRDLISEIARRRETIAAELARASSGWSR